MLNKRFCPKTDRFKRDSHFSLSNSLVSFLFCFSGIIGRSCHKYSFCRAKHVVVATKIILVAASANIADLQWLRFDCRGPHALCQLQDVWPACVPSPPSLPPPPPPPNNRKWKGPVFHFYFVDDIMKSILIYYVCVKTFSDLCKTVMKVCQVCGTLIT